MTLGEWQSPRNSIAFAQSREDSDDDDDISEAPTSDIPTDTSSIQQMPVANQQLNAANEMQQTAPVFVSEAQMHALHRLLWLYQVCEIIYFPFIS